MTAPKDRAGVVALMRAAMGSSRAITGDGFAADVLAALEAAELRVMPEIVLRALERLIAAQHRFSRHAKSSEPVNPEIIADFEAAHREAEEALAAASPFAPPPEDPA